MADKIPQRLKLYRVLRNSKVTLGIIILNGEFVCCTVERPWLDNIQNKSCIPCGIYLIEWGYSERFGESLRLRDVPGRSGILIHKANFAKELRGCIAPGLFYTIAGGSIGVQSSAIALGKLKNLLIGAREISIEIINA